MPKLKQFNLENAGVKAVNPVTEALATAAKNITSNVSSTASNQANKLSTSATKTATSNASASVNNNGSGGLAYTSTSYSPTFGYGGYKESQYVTDARNAMNAFGANKYADWTGGTYGNALSQAMDKIANREKFSYDLNGDALYQQYKDNYINQGRMAMMDTLGQAAGLTGGYGNSYASTAGNQAYQGYLSQLNNAVTDLYNLAYDKYNREGEDLYNQMNMYKNAYDTEYGQYRDNVSDWYNEYDRLSNAYYNAYNQDYGKYSDDYNRALSTFNANKSAAQNKTLATLGNSVNTALSTPDLTSIAKAAGQATNTAMNTAYNSLASQSNPINTTDSAIKSFIANIETPAEIGQRGVASPNAYTKTNSNMAGAELLDSMAQKQSVNDELRKWYESGMLTESQVAYLKAYYGL